MKLDRLTRAERDRTARNPIATYQIHSQEQDIPAAVRLNGQVIAKEIL
jgi:hypothetical protein